MLQIYIVLYTSNIKENYLCLSVVVFYKNSIFYIQRIQKILTIKLRPKPHTQNANQIEGKMKLRFPLYLLSYQELSFYFSENTNVCLPSGLFCQHTTNIVNQRLRLLLFNNIRIVVMW